MRNTITLINSSPISCTSIVKSITIDEIPSPPTEFAARLNPNALSTKAIANVKII